MSEPQGTVEQPRQSPKDIARAMFIRVSIQQPASVFGQATAIAHELKTKQSPFSALELGNSLLVDTATITELTNIANNVHKARGARQDSRFEPITDARTRGIILQDFHYAEQMKHLSIENLAEILAYISGRPKETIPTREYHLKLLINQLLSKTEQVALTGPDDEYIRDANSMRYPE